ncbi:lysosomal alpha-mannosidase [Tribolium castaneum]|uniref:Alpha-mannosidase n=1 Tax=Tribolium castaneum TaxID=7070 RepID=A0A139WD66_TRICA|nr:PREDICTED: lysosomal alpha-mannosidase-like [Tribolium castaneum]KYB25899.1 Alpha-mannosidase 2-like Protein [Tribolium castaneum]|eukprot:XP_015838086.1 PREDICTED: lysosomal alpha-mannosidase-like [Tribolium castaneum]
MLAIFFLVLNLYFVVSGPVLETDSTCTSPCKAIDNEKINVHLVPHSHDDVGWLKTYEEYYQGTGQFNSYENAGVQYILDSTIEALDLNSERRFIQVETAFFWRWWNDQTNQTRNKVRKLVNNGQLEMINGAWSMNDEAAAHYQSIIDQFTWGFRILDDTVGECGKPKIGWQIDPFGHSREHASIMKQLGFEGLVIGRLDYRDKGKRIAEKNLDFMWNTNDNFDDAKLFTTMFPDFYVSESGFCFDVTCYRGTNITDDNIDEKVKEFAERMDTYKEYYQTKNILLPMGGDFTFQKAEINFANIDKLIEGFKNHEKYNVLYSTPSCYIQAVKAEVDKNKITLKEKSDDFFPYASDSHSFWTGYFTSRPASKRFERIGNNLLQSAKQLTTFSRINGNDDDKNILKLRMAMGVMQHHDAITGTEKQAVTDDYSLQLDGAIKEAQKPLSNIIRDLLKKKEDVSVDLKLTTCLLSNISICDTTQNKDRFLVAVQNPLAKTVSHYVRLPVNGDNYKITGPDDEEIKYDLLDTMYDFSLINGGDHATKELVFQAVDLPPLGVKLFYVEKIDGTSKSYHKFEEITTDRSFGDKSNGFTVDDKGKLTTITINGQVLDIAQDFYFYHGSAGSSASASTRASGAYIFRPDGDAVQVTPKLKVQEFAKGGLVDEVRQVYNDEITQIIRVYKGKDDSYIEFDWLVGNLQRDDKGKEVITKFTSTVKNNGIFYTDANGRQQIQRQRNKRSDYDYDPSEEPVSSNYYPITSKIVIKDETQKLQVAVLNDRAQGGGSLEDGEIELMVHRRDRSDDGFGVNEVLDEVQFGKGLYVRGQHYLTLGKTDGSGAVFERDLAHKKLLSPLILVGDATTDELALDKLKEQFNFKFEGLKTSLPGNVQLLTLEPWKNSYIMRLEHIFEKNEDTEMSKEVTVDLNDLFTLFKITELTPVTLGANKKIETKSNFITRLTRALRLSDNADLKMTLKPMEIKTFIFTTDKNNDGGEDNGIIDGKDDNNNSQALRATSVLVILMSALYMLL